MKRNSRPNSEPGADARRLAYDALVAVDRRSVFVSQVLDDLFAERNPSTTDRGLAREIAAGVVRRRLTVDTILARHVSRPQEEIEPELWALLRIGVYQLVFLSIPAHAAVHETVELARRLQKLRWLRFANAVLRSVERELTDEYTDNPSADSVPIIRDAAGQLSVTYRRLRQAHLTPPESNIAEYVSQAFSLPQWLIDRWILRDSGDEALRRGAWFATPGRMSLRVNQLKTDRETVLEVLHTADVEAQPGNLPEAVRLTHTVRIENVPGFAEGWFSVQDESAMQAVVLLDPQPGERVLDLCAAPGGKTAHIAERMRNDGRIDAIDVHSARLGLVNAAAKRLGLTIIRTHLAEADSTGLPEGPYDRVLVDVPCSNTGVLGKRPEARWRISAQGLDELAELQTRLLTSAAERIASGGRLVYSTCSIEPEENEQVVRRLLAMHADLHLDSEHHHAPGLPSDGGYLALLIRT